MEDKKGFGFWVFASNDPELTRFCDTLTDIDSLYCIIYIKECGISYSPEIEELLHLYDGSILFVDPLLIRIYARLQINCRFIILSKLFFQINQTKIFFKYFAFHKMPKGVICVNNLVEEQIKCMEMIEEEYRRSGEKFQPVILKNLIVSILMLYFPKYTLHLRSGHLLDYAVRFVDLLETYGLQERKKDFYADKIGITEQSLAHMLQTVFGKPFKEIIVYQIVDEATKRLVFDNQNTAQIALDLDYDLSGFNKMFIKRRGMRPADLQQRYHDIINQI
jgi:AraC-like DNA-binding protein